jgi:hypothetical protein
MKFSELLEKGPSPPGVPMEGYWAELINGKMKTTRAVISATGKPFFCLSKEDIEKVLARLSNEGCHKINKTALLLTDNNDMEIAFDLSEVFYFTAFGKDFESHEILLDVNNLPYDGFRWAEEA